MKIVVSWQGKMHVGEEESWEIEIPKEIELLILALTKRLSEQ